MTLPILLDIEASGFGRGSYPIEIGLARADGSSCAFLIQPRDEWVHWDPKAELLHGISRARLAREGRPVREVAQWVNDELGEAGIAYSDSWGYDNTWLSLLFYHAGMLPRFRLEALRRLLDEEQLNCWAELKEAVIAEGGIQRHRAGDDARLLQLTWQKAQSIGRSE
ncbi:3'-5' exonuclease [Cobetia amphilecti]|uniref:3'-5' exonuclease n=1 Tax=Cobetia amphilecti TaxID=1055104 RepID=UPI003F633AB8